MPLDGVTIHYLTQSFQEALSGGRIDKIGQPSRSALVLQVRNAGETHRLLLDANPQNPVTCLIPRPLPNLERAPHFTMMLRKHLQGAFIESVTNEDFERVIKIRCRTRNEMGDETHHTLIAELMGRHSNIVLINRNERIVDAIRHVDSRVNRVRETLPAHPYVAPPRQDKMTPDEALRELNGPDPALFIESSATVIEILVKRIAGISPFLAKEVSYIADVAGRSLASLSPAERHAVHWAAQGLLQRIVTGPPSPTLYTEPNEAVDYHAFNLAYLKNKTPMATLSEAIAAALEHVQAKQALARERADLLRDVKQRMQKLAKRIRIHSDDIAQGELADTYKYEADLIYANLYRIASGDTTLVANDFVTNAPVEIALNENIPPQKQAERRYKLYRKATTKKKTATSLLAADHLYADYLASLESAIELARDRTDLLALAAELAELDRRDVTEKEPLAVRDLPGRPASKKRKMQKTKQKDTARQRAASERPDYRVFYTSTGHEVLVGRNNLQNDRLTLKDAAKTDLWLHVHAAPGSHVIVRGELATLPDAAVLEAAGLAAWFSSLNKGSGAAIDVDYCPAGHVKKGAGQRPGQVIYEKYYQVRVQPLAPEALPAHVVS